MQENICNVAKSRIYCQAGSGPVVHICIFSPWEAEAGELKLEVNLGYSTKILTQKGWGGGKSPTPISVSGNLDYG